MSKYKTIVNNFVLYAIFVLFQSVYVTFYSVLLITINLFFYKCFFFHNPDYSVLISMILQNLLGFLEGVWTEDPLQLRQHPGVYRGGHDRSRSQFSGEITVAEQLVNVRSLPDVSLQTRSENIHQPCINIGQLWKLYGVINIRDCLELHQWMLDVRKWQFSVGQLIQDTSQTPNISLVTNLDTWLPVSLFVHLRSTLVLD